MQDPVAQVSQKLMLVSRRVIPAVTLCLLLASAGGLVLHAQTGSDAEQQKQQMKQIIDQMYNRLNDFQAKGPGATAPDRDLQRYCGNLDTAVRQYLADYGVSPLVSNRLKDLYGQCLTSHVGEKEGLVKAEQELEQMYTTYKTLNERYSTMQKKIVLVKIVKGLIDILTLPTDCVATITQMTLQKLEGLYNPDFAPLGTKTDPVLKKRMVKELYEENKKLVQILYQPMPDDDSFVRTVGEARKQTTVCAQKANELIKKLQIEREQVSKEQTRLCDKIHEWAEKVDEILATQAGKQHFEIRPKEIVLTPQHKTDVVAVFRIGQSSEIKLPAGDVYFEDTTTPPAVAIGTDGKVTGLRDTNTEISAIIAGGPWAGQRPDGRINVTVQMAGKTPPGKPPVQPPAVTPTNVVPPSPGRPGARCSIGFTISPEKSPCPLGTTLTFTDDVDGKNPDSTYTYTWRVDDRVIATQTLKGNSGTRSSANWTCDKPGAHYVQLALSSSSPGDDDAINRNIFVEYPPDLTVDFEILTPLETIAPGDKVDVRQHCQNAQEVTEYRWLLDGNYLGSGESFQFTLKDSGRHEITLVIRKGSNVDEDKASKTVTVGEAGLKKLGTWINRFKPEEGSSGLRMLSSFYRGGDATWSAWAAFRSIGEVEGYAFCTGEQADGYNTGFLVFAPPKNPNLRFEVYRFNFQQSVGDVTYSGGLPMHNKKPDPKSLQFTSIHSRAAEIQWQSRDGATCRARIWKSEASGFVKGGVEDLGCVEGTAPKKPDTGKILALPFSDDFAAGADNWDITGTTPEKTDGKLMWNAGNFASVSPKVEIPIENVIVEFDGWTETNGFNVYLCNSAGKGYTVFMGGWFNTKSGSDIGGNAKNRETVDGAVFTPRAWHHYKVERRGNTLAAYCDGKLVVSRTSSARFSGPGRLRINSWSSRLGIDNVSIIRADGSQGKAGNGGESLTVDAMKSGGAWFTTRRPYDLTGDYSVKFEFMLREAKGHWLTLYSDGLIYLTMGWGTELVHHQPGRSWELTAPLMKLDLNRWYRVELEASPTRGTVDISIDGKKVCLATGLKPVLAWHTLNKQMSDPTM